MIDLDKPSAPQFLQRAIEIVRIARPDAMRRPLLEPRTVPPRLLASDEPEPCFLGAFEWHARGATKRAWGILSSFHAEALTRIRCRLIIDCSFYVLIYIRLILCQQLNSYIFLVTGR